MEDLEYIISVSGGKDSTATALYLMERGIPFRAVHLDTGWEHPDTERYVRDVLPGYIGPIEIALNLPTLNEELDTIATDLEARHMGGAKSAFVRWMLKKAMFSSRKNRYCTGVLKIEPFQAWARENTDWPDFVSVIGVRAQESHARSGLPAWDMDDEGYVVWRPLIDWTEEQVIDLHLRHNIPPNPLYTRGASRVGCWPCIQARKAEIRQVVEMDPGRIALMRELEIILTERALGRMRTKGKPTHHVGGEEKFRSYFQNPYYRRELREKIAQAPAGLTEDEATEWAKARTLRQARIDDVVAWSKTNRKGEPEPFAALPHERGCTRWGFCDVAWTGVDDPDLLRGPSRAVPSGSAR